ncbi:MAG TPA: hypothetical protein VKN82_08885, partial [Desulfohalobiaceae bacterium]|nr:hypothetical protein [Desulfohalobiaceae bacterium]
MTDTLRIDIDSQDASQNINNLETQVESAIGKVTDLQEKLSNLSSNEKINVEIKEDEKALDQVKKRLEKVLGEAAEISVSVNQADLQHMKDQISDLKEEISLSINSEEVAQSIKDSLEKIKENIEDITINIVVSEKSKKDLDGLGKTTRKKVDIEVDDTKLSKLETQLNKAEKRYQRLQKEMEKMAKQDHLHNRAVKDLSDQDRIIKITANTDRIVSELNKLSDLFDKKEFNIKTSIDKEKFKDIEIELKEADKIKIKNFFKEVSGLVNQKRTLDISTEVLDKKLQKIKKDLSIIERAATGFGISSEQIKQAKTIQDARRIGRDQSQKATKVPPNTGVVKETIIIKEPTQPAPKKAPVPKVISQPAPKPIEEKTRSRVVLETEAILEKIKDPEKYPHHKQGDESFKKLYSLFKKGKVPESVLQFANKIYKDNIEGITRAKAKGEGI